MIIFVDMDDTIERAFGVKPIRGNNLSWEGETTP
jgi:hypothetical protein